MLLKIKDNLIINVDNIASIVETFVWVGPVESKQCCVEFAGGYSLKLSMSLKDLEQIFEKARIVYNDPSVPFEHPKLTKPKLTKPSI